MKHRIFTLCLAGCLLFGSAYATATGVVKQNAQTAGQNPKREFRSVWMAGMGIDWPYGNERSSAKQKEQLITYLDRLKEQNFTGFCLHVRPRADAYYKSTLEPWSADFTGTRGKDPGWDPLAFAIEEAHKRGLEIYAWVNPYRVNADNVTYTTAFDKEWQQKGWLIKHYSWTSFNPGLPEARKHCLDVMKELYTNYMIDGLLFDDYFYPGNGMPGGPDHEGQDAEAADYQLWKDAKSGLSIADWRRENVNSFMRELYADIQATRPDMRFGIGPAGIGHDSAAARGLPKPNITAAGYQYAKIYADPLAWLEDGSIDFIAPQIYWQRTHSTAPYEPLCEWWSMVADHYGRHNYVSIAAYKVTNDAFSGGSLQGGIAEINAQVELTRTHTYNAAPGAIFYNTKSINGPFAEGIGDDLGATLYSTPALVPPVTWKEHVVYPAPANATVSGNTLTWDAAKASEKAIIRYTVYAVPTAVSSDEALSADGDGIDGRYLLGVTYSPSYTLPADKDTGYWYAVCVYDGYGLESEPALIAYNIGDRHEAAAATLVSPADNAVIEDMDINFTWSGNEPSDEYPATYTLEIIPEGGSFDSPARKFTVTHPIQSVSIKTSTLGTGKYSWRVVTRSTIATPTPSVVYTFSIDDMPVGSYEDGYVVKTDNASYASTDGFKISSLWYRAATAPYSNMTFESNGSLSRGMAATQECVYVSGRSEVSTHANIYLDVYSATSGEHIRSLNLSSDGQVAYLPCNDVFKDTKGNICISNLSLNISTTPIIIHRVNTADGSLKTVATLTYSGGGRVDHVAVYGDVTTRKFYVFAAVAGTNKILRWELATGGKNSSPKVATCTTLYPAAAANFAIAPRVYPVSNNLVYVDGSATAWTLYDFSTGTVAGSFSKAANAAPSGYSDNGGAVFKLGDQTMCIYSHTPVQEGTRFVIASYPNSDFANLNPLWYVPSAGLGSVSSSTCSTPVDAVNLTDSRANVYLYSPGNGLVAYSVTHTPSGVSDIRSDSDPESSRLQVFVNGMTVTIANAAKSIKAYNTIGALVAETTDSDTLTLPTSGTYIIRTSEAVAIVFIR